AHKSVKGFFALMSDISDRKAIERMKDEFISVVSHELRTPLTSLHSALKILTTGRLGTLSANGQQMLEIADENTERLVRLVNNVLDLQRIESGEVTMEKQACSAADLMIQAMEAMQPMAQQHGVMLSTQTVDIQIWADSDYIVQALTNLLSNAIKFSSPGGTVWLTVECFSAEALFQVRDRGQGVPADKLESIFERFQQVDSSDSRKKGGTGLGLTICRKIIEQHDGRIWAESTLGRGSTFFFTLPALSI
ncbi:MAG: sensor histidine kinase, partial [Microcystaceae cyanobacterium]